MTLTQVQEAMLQWADVDLMPGTRMAATLWVVKGFLEEVHKAEAQAKPNANSRVLKPRSMAKPNE